MSCNSCSNITLPGVVGPAGAPGASGAAASAPPPVVPAVTKDLFSDLGLTSKPTFTSKDKTNPAVKPKPSTKLKMDASLAAPAAWDDEEELDLS